MMNKVIPILPCHDIKAQVAFYQQLGFELMDLFTSPNPYAVLQLGTIELNFYGSRKMVPTENPTMCFVKVEDVDALYAAFAGGLKKHTGKIPRSGIPRISKVRDLSSDRRFTLTDTGGNTFYIGTPVKGDNHNFFRTLDNEEWAQKFSVLYDVVYSKEDAQMAANMLPRYGQMKDQLNDLDKVKFLLIVLEIQQQLGIPVNDGELKSSIEAHKDHGDHWEAIRKKYSILIQEE